MRTVSTTEARNRFGQVLREVAKSGGPIFVERDGKPVAVILSIHKYERTRRRPILPRDKAALIRSAFGMWSIRTDITDDWIAKGRALGKCVEE
jgi:prevent-host-death family protein